MCGYTTPGNEKNSAAAAFYTCLFAGVRVCIARKTPSRSPPPSPPPFRCALYAPWPFNSRTHVHVVRRDIFGSRKRVSDTISHPLTPHTVSPTRPVAFDPRFLHTRTKYPSNFRSRVVFGYLNTRLSRPSGLCFVILLCAFSFLISVYDTPQ